MATITKLVLEIDVDDSELDVAAKKADKLSGSFSGLKKVTGALAIGGVAALGAGIWKLNNLVDESIGLAAIQQDAEAQLGAVLESTGGVAGVTADQMKNLASELQTMTTYGDEAIIGAESLLLTFTKIGGEVMPDAVQTVLDMSTAMGQDLKSSAIQLGKALNDPIAGVGALSRVGVQFSEDQKAMIESLTETGDILGAQQIILDELSTQFGGSASAAAETYAGRMQQLQNAIGDLKEQIGFAFMPILTELAEKALPMVQDAIRLSMPVLQDWSKQLSDTAGPALVVILDALRRIGEVFGIVNDEMSNGEALVKALEVSLNLLTDGLMAVAVAAQLVADALEGMKNGVSFLDSNSTNIAGKLGQLAGSVTGISGIVQNSNLLGFAEGGVVPGPIGAAQLAVVHGGETIIPPGAGGNTSNIYIGDIQVGSVDGSIDDGLMMMVQVLRQKLSQAHQ